MTTSLQQEFSEKQTTPLEIINLFLSEGRSTGNKACPLFNKINREFSWHALLEYGYQIEMASLLHYILERKSPYEGAIAVSDDVRKRLKSIRNQLLVSKLLQKAVISDVFDAFEKDGIPVIPLKGACLAREYYPESTLRNMNDIDILVQAKHKTRSMDCMRKSGFVFHSTKHDESYYHKNHFHIPYVKIISGMPVMVELHFHIALQSFFNNIQIEDLWVSATPISSQYSCVCVPGKEWILLHCLWHTYLNISKTGAIKLFWLMDIIFLIKDTKQKIDWYFLENILKKTWIQKRAYFCMDLINILMDIRLHENLPNFLRPPRYEKILFNFIIFSCIRLDRINENTNVLKVLRKIRETLFIPLLKHISIQDFSRKTQFLKQELQEIFKQANERIVY